MKQHTADLAKLQNFITIIQNFLEFQFLFRIDSPSIIKIFKTTFKVGEIFKLVGIPPMFITSQ